MESNQLNKSQIKLMLGEIIDGYLYEYNVLPEDFYIFYLEMVGMTRYKRNKSIANKHSNYATTYKFRNIYNILKDNDKTIFVDLYFRYKEGLFYDPSIKFRIFESFNSSHLITKEYVSLVAKQSGMQEKFIKNFIRVMLERKVVSKKVEQTFLKKTIFNKEIKKKINEGFVYADKDNKYMINKNGDIYKVLKSTYQFKKVNPVPRENNTGSKYFIISMNSQQVHLHRLIARLFTPNPNHYKYIRAKDNNFLNINPKNLEWVKYPAATRIIKNISINSHGWLNFIINNFEDGIEINALSAIIADIAEEKGLFKNNNNKAQTVCSVIEKYSQSNQLFPMFNITEDGRRIVFMNRNVYNKVKEGMVK